MWLIALTSGAAAVTMALSTRKQAECASTKEYSLAEVAKHRTKETGIWVTYKDGHPAWS